MACYGGTWGTLVDLANFYRSCEVFLDPDRIFFAGVWEGRSSSFQGRVYRGTEQVKPLALLFTSLFMTLSRLSRISRRHHFNIRNSQLQWYRYLRYQ